jgi:ADP-heptose:LPS heptosyltransferase
MMAHPEHDYLVASHNDCIPEFFRSLGISVEELSLGRLKGAKNCPRTLFLNNNPFPRQDPIFTDRRPVIGVHLGGSGYSISVEKRFGFPSKALPLRVLVGLVLKASQYNFLLFGSVDELDQFGLKESPRLRLVRNEDISVNLSHIAECSGFVGSDSAFKTMSAMLRIPTVVWIGDYRDDNRDDNFINPYVTAGVVSAFRYKDLRRYAEVNSGVDFSLDRLSSRLMADA